MQNCYVAEVLDVDVQIDSAATGFFRLSHSSVTQLNVSPGDIDAYLAFLAAHPPPPTTISSSTSSSKIMHTATAAFSHLPAPPAPAGSSAGTGAEPLRTSVGHLLTRACALPCSAAAHAFAQLVQPTARFQLALDALLPMLESRHVELPQRILVSYIMYALYAPYPLAINPFRTALRGTFTRERELAMVISQSASSSTPAGSTMSGISDNEQFVWVLWKILRGDGNDIGPYSPNTLARSPLPPKLRAANLILDDDYMKDNASDAITLSDSFSSHPPARTDGSSSSFTGTIEVDGKAEITSVQDTENEELAHAMSLLLAARERVLTLSEQRILTPHIRTLTSPPVITPVDLPSLISNNPTLSHSLFIALLTAPFSSPAGSSMLAPASSSYSQSRAQLKVPLPITMGPTSYLIALTTLPPTLPSFDLLGRLLRDPTALFLPSPTDSPVVGPRGERLGGTSVGRTTVADVVRMEVLGSFVHSAITWLENAEREELEGRIADDRFAKGVQNLCRFYRSLIKLDIIDPVSDTDTTEMAHFALRNSRFEEATALYRIFATGKF